MSEHRRAVVVVALVALAALPLVGVARAANPTLVVQYVGCSSLTVSPSPVPAGTYDVLVYDDNNCPAAFSITGPGVNLTSDLNSSGMGIDHPAQFGPFTFQAGSSYSVRDANMPAGAAISFSPTSGGSASSTGGSSSSSGGSTSSSSSSGPSSTTSNTSSSSKASATGALGTIIGTISASGKASLTYNGKKVTTLKAGVYKLTIKDASKNAGLILQALGHTAMTETTAAWVGTGTHKLRLIPDKYLFRPSSGGRKTYFTVTH